MPVRFCGAEMSSCRPSLESRDEQAVSTINSVFIYHTKSHPCLPSRISRQSLAYL